MYRRSVNHSALCSVSVHTHAHTTHFAMQTTDCCPTRLRSIRMQMKHIVRPACDAPQLLSECVCVLCVRLSTNDICKSAIGLVGWFAGALAALDPRTRAHLLDASSCITFWPRNNAIQHTTTTAATEPSRNGPM